MPVATDGGKAGMTAYNIHEWQLQYMPRTRTPALCDPRVRTVQEHWRFGNTHNLGWIATVWTAGVGLLAVCMALWLSCQQRARRVRVLDVAEAFALGWPEAVSNDEVFYLKHGRILKESDM